MFSSGGKEVLIKTAAQAIYAMSVFKLLGGLWGDIQRAIVRFWWGSKEDKNGIHWVRWDKLSHVKSRGGLGFRDFISFNQALVAKQRWRLLQFSNSLVSKVLRAMYYKNSDFLHASLGSNTSFVWRSILWGRQGIKAGIRWRIGNGQSILMYKDNWLPRPNTFKPMSPPRMLIHTVVADLIKARNQWDEDKLNQHFIQEDLEVILNTSLLREKAKDEVMWHYDKRGEYSVKGGYQLALKLKYPEASSSSGNNPRHRNTLWSLEIPEKVKIFMWRAIKNLLPSAKNLWKRKVLQESICQRCNRNVESINHTLLDSKATKKIWIQGPRRSPPQYSNAGCSQLLPRNGNFF